MIQISLQVKDEVIKRSSMFQNTIKSYCFLQNKMKDNLQIIINDECKISKNHQIYF